MAAVTFGHLQQSWMLLSASIQNQQLQSSRALPQYAPEQLCAILSNACEHLMHGLKFPVAVCWLPDESRGRKWFNKTTCLVVTVSNCLIDS